MNQKISSVQSVRDRIARAAERAGRSGEDVTLVAVSKTKPMEDIVAAYEAGIRHFGENRTEELAAKAHALVHLPELQWHFIGQLQSRQCKEVALHAHCFHAVDRMKIAERLSRELGEAGRELPVYIQVNVSGEQSKGGFACAEWEHDDEQLGQFVESVRAIAALPNLKILGLMTMAAFNAPEDELRAVFKRLHGLSERLNAANPDLDAKGLSMGMSGDFEIAIAEGATLVRVGSAIFGGRG